MALTRALAGPVRDGRDRVSAGSFRVDVGRRGKAMMTNYLIMLAVVSYIAIGIVVDALAFLRDERKRRANLGREGKR
jgi:hypothetical protein